MPLPELFGDVESRAKQAAAMRKLAACIELGEVYAVVTIVVGDNGPDGPRSEYSDWRDITQPELMHPRQVIRRVLEHHLREGAISVAHEIVRADAARGLPAEGGG